MMLGPMLELILFQISRSFFGQKRQMFRKFCKRSSANFERITFQTEYVHCPLIISVNSTHILV